MKDPFDKTLKVEKAIVNRFAKEVVEFLHGISDQINDKRTKGIIILTTND